MYLLIDEKQALERLSGNQGLLTALLTTFRDKYFDTENKINEYLAQKNADELKNYIHSIKGSSLNLSLEMLAQHCLKLESAISNCDIDEVLIAKFLEVYKNTIIEINKYISSH